MATVTVIVPLRSPGRGKTRLADALGPEHRAALAGAMFADVIAALQAAPVERILVAAGGPEAAAAASALGVDAHIDPPTVSSLDAAIAAAAARLDRGTELLVVAADLPRLTATDVGTLLAADAEVVVSPTHGGGTGGLLRRPADRITTAYGTASARRHQDLARTAGASFASVPTTGFRADVDTSTDLAALRGGPLGPATSKLLAGWPDLDDLAV